MSLAFHLECELHQLMMAVYVNAFCKFLTWWVIIVVIDFITIIVVDIIAIITVVDIIAIITVVDIISIIIVVDIITITRIIITTTTIKLPMVVLIPW